MKTATRPSSGSSGRSRSVAGDRAVELAADRDDEVRDEAAVEVEVGVEVVARADDEHAAVDRDRRDRGAAAVEDDDVRPALGGERARPRETFETNDLAGEPAAGAAAADRGRRR